MISTSTIATGLGGFETQITYAAKQNNVVVNTTYSINRQRVYSDQLGRSAEHHWHELRSPLLTHHHLAFRTRVGITTDDKHQTKSQLFYNNEFHATLIFTELILPIM